MWKCCNVVLHADCSQSICRGVCGLIVLGASPEQMRVIPPGSTAGEEVIIQTFGAMDVGVLMLLVFLICRENLFWILSLSLAYSADKHVGGLASGRSGVFNIQNCPLDFWYVFNWSTDISAALVSSSVMPKYFFPCHRMVSSLHEVYQS